MKPVFMQFERPDGEFATVNLLYVMAVFDGAEHNTAQILISSSHLITVKGSQIATVSAIQKALEEGQ